MMDRQTDGLTDRRTNGLTDQRINGPTDQQTDPHIEMCGRILKHFFSERGINVQHPD